MEEKKEYAGFADPYGLIEMQLVQDDDLKYFKEKNKEFKSPNTIFFRCLLSDQEYREVQKVQEEGLTEVALSMLKRRGEKFLVKPELHDIWNNIPSTRLR